MEDCWTPESTAELNAQVDSARLIAEASPDEETALQTWADTDEAKAQMSQLLVSLGMGNVSIEDVNLEAVMDEEGNHTGSYAVDVNLDEDGKFKVGGDTIKYDDEIGFNIRREDTDGDGTGDGFKIDSIDGMNVDVFGPMDPGFNFFTITQTNCVAQGTYEAAVPDGVPGKSGGLDLDTETYTLTEGMFQQVETIQETK